MIDVDVDMDCSPGTYVRALARDLGATLGVGGHLVALRRTAVGGFTLADAAPLDDLISGDVSLTVLPLPEVAARLLPRRDVDAEHARILSHGGPLPAIGQTGPYAVFGPDARVLAVMAERDGMARAAVVLAPAGAEADRTAEGEE
jgi:tRNA pseudouridine55 synthase